MLHTGCFGCCLRGQFEDPEAAQLSEKFWEPGSVRSAEPRDVLRIQSLGTHVLLALFNSLLPHLKEKMIHFYSTAQMGSLGPFYLFLTMQSGTEGVKS